MPSILVDATSLSDDSHYRGIGTYVRQILGGLARDPSLSVSAFCWRKTDLPRGVEAVPLIRLTPGRWRVTEHELRLPIDLARQSADVFQSPALTPPWRCARPWLQTLHDVIPLVYDDPALKVERRRWRRHAERYRQATGIVAVSRYTADIGIKVLGLDPRRVEVIPHGVDSRFRPPSDGGVPRQNHLLLVGEYSKRKGYPEAFAVAGELAERGYPHRLRVTGRIAPWVRPAVNAAVAAAPEPQRIDLLGFVDDLVAEYQQARVLIMSSRYEGFGLPILEAMACGTPVVAFANSSLVEVVGDAGILVADGDVPAMARAVRSLLDDEQLWSDLSSRGLERVKAFSWQNSVDAHAQLLSSLAERPPVRRMVHASRTTTREKLTLLIDGWHLAGFGATRGFGRYLRALLNQLAGEPRVDARVMVTTPGWSSVRAGLAADPIHRIVPGRFADLEHRIRLPLDIARHRSMVFHSPAQEPPRWCGRAWVQTLHDVPLSFEDANLADEVTTWQRRRARVQYADGVVAVSQHVADRATSLLGLDPQRVHVAHHGVDDIFSPDPLRRPGKGEPGQGDPYVLFVSEYGPHKGYREAFALIDKLVDLGLPHRLVVLGRLASWWRGIVDELVSESRHPERIQLAGLADDDALVRWYRRADALVVTSRAEGFGLPVVEAMACGTPVIAFDNTALPEVIGSGGLLVPDGDVRALAATVSELLRTTHRWRDWSARAFQRSRAFSWSTCAAAHVEVYEEAWARRRASRALI